MTTPITSRPAGLDELPLSGLQQRIWFLCTAYHGDASPIVFLAWRITGPLRTDVWLRAVDAVVDRHESLRTSFVLRDGEPVQVVHPPAGLDTEQLDLTHLPGPEREEQTAQLTAARTRALIDLVDGPLVRSTLIRLDDDQHVWCFTMHHLLADGASLEILDRDLRILYRSFVQGVEPDLPELPVQYGDFALWQQTVQQPAAEADLHYWREKLAGVPLLDLPTDLPRPAEKGVCGAELIHQAGAGLAERIAGLARAQRCTSFMVLHAAVQVLLNSYTGQDDFCVGSPVGGRTSMDLEPVIGLFANTLALRADLSGDPTFGELLRRTRTTVLGALSRQHVPFGRIVTALDLPRVPNRTQVFQVIFNMRVDRARNDAELAGLRIEDFPHAHPKTLHDLVIDIWRLDEQVLRTGFRYDDTLFTAETVAAMAGRYERLLTAIVDRPEARLSDLVASSLSE